jgi:hypothetical protein
MTTSLPVFPGAVRPQGIQQTDAYATHGSRGRGCEAPDQIRSFSHQT